MSGEVEWIEEVEGDFLLHKAVLNGMSSVPNGKEYLSRTEAGLKTTVMPMGTKVLTAERYGTSAWARTGKITVLSPENEHKRYFLKCITGKGARALAEGEYHSAAAMTAAAPGLVPEPVGWGTYHAEGLEYFFYLGNYHDLDLAAAPEPGAFAARVAQFHSNGTSPNGMFGFQVPTTIGIMERTVAWESSWAKSFARQLQDVIGFDDDTNGPWPEFRIAVNHLIEAVIPRLLGALQSDGRQITPALVHGDLWEHNVGIDMESGEIIIFDPGCTYAHNEMEFGTWRCSWAYHFNSPMYQRMYQRHIEPSEPVDEWDDRNRLYSIYPYLVDSAGHAGSVSRKVAYNDILYLCEKYAPSDDLEKYDPEKDLSVTKAYTPFVISQLE
ncbi:hypothetical protein LTR17_016125 [Elasticomyces elasticus]|nr:hypothetical protein LTR17_016125 [Elasticomyces elasticus]